MSEINKKAIFQLKLTGAYDALLQYTFMKGYVDGLKRTAGKSVQPSDIEAAYVKFSAELEKDLKSEKPT